ncbi:hypothetical protein [Capnocytophaga granulosa]|uniref:hypothetical protein n=1 Tax=Capnocytophaga granulosa TaxID=45242 RepID=UPI0028EC88DB|nr:hypothetical protein [Capnocytophaga granulosa]
MEEALDILWTYARREPIESNGKTIVATISQSIAAIRLIMRLEGWLQRGEKQKVKSEKQTAPASKGKAHDSGASEQFAQSNIDTPTSTCLVSSSPRERKLRISRQEPNHSTAKVAYPASKPRKVCRQRPCVKGNKSPNHTSKPRKVCRQRSAAKEDLYKEITLIESPIREASLNCVSSLTLAKALPP